MNQKITILIILGLLIIGAGTWFLLWIPTTSPSISSYDDCAAAGYQILETYPEQCRTPDGRTFTREIKSNISDLIRVTAPQPGSLVQSPLVITGEARGRWYFEAVFPVKITDSNGTVVAQGSAQAEGEWQTENFVPFKATLTFNPPVNGPGTLILQNDNPSGLPEKNKELRIPVRFSGGKAILASSFNKPLVFKVGQQAVFPDGLSLILKEINDSRCQPNVQCVWSGELSALFAINTGSVSEDLRLGAVSNKTANLRGYSFTLQTVSPESVTILVKAPPILSGLNGNIHIGPTCPVERNPPDPACADRPYVNARVSIENKTNGSIVSQVVSDNEGNFRVVILPGVYIVDVQPMNNNILPRCPPKEVVVKTGVFVNVDVSCDSGIR